VTNSRTGSRLLIRPSKKSLREHARRLKGLFREGRGKSAPYLTVKINPVIRGWTNYFRVGVSARAFQKLDDYLFKLQRRWVKRSHPTKPWKWRMRRYWGECKYRKGTDRWVFQSFGVHMLKHAWTPIKRHTLVRRFASWDDPDLERYWDARMKRETGDSL